MRAEFDDGSPIDHRHQPSSSTVPYFFILPIYVLILLGLLLASGTLLLIKPLRHWSSFVAVGALGTLPGFVLGNLIFWLITWAVFSLLQRPFQQVASDVVKGVAGVAGILFLMVGLALANIVGVIAGFLGGVWVRFRFQSGRPG
jgi:hypothetical protein